MILKLMLQKPATLTEKLLNQKIMLTWHQPMTVQHSLKTMALETMHRVEMTVLILLMIKPKVTNPPHLLQEVLHRQHQHQNLDRHLQKALLHPLVLHQLLEKHLLHLLKHLQYLECFLPLRLELLLHLLKLKMTVTNKI